MRAIEPQTVYPVGDTYVDSASVSAVHGLEEYLKVSDNNIGISVALLMFDLSGVSHDSNVSFEAKLRLCGLSVNSSYVIGAHWCVNNTWNEDTFTFVNFSYFFRTKPESETTILPLGSEDVWYEWVVTDFVRTAIREKYENITFGLEAEEAVQGNGFAMFYSKDQQQVPPPYGNPQLVFTYHDIGGISLDMIGEVVFGVLVTAGIIFMAYRLLNKPGKKRRRSSYAHAKVNVV